MRLIGIHVNCTTCGRTKAPHGRSVPLVGGSSYCTPDDCDGYSEAPLAGCLWPGETEEAFGYPVCAHATAESGWREGEEQR